MEPCTPSWMRQPHPCLTDVLTLPETPNQREVQCWLGYILLELKPLGIYKCTLDLIKIVLWLCFKRMVSHILPLQSSFPTGWGRCWLVQIQEMQFYDICLWKMLLNWIIQKMLPLLPLGQFAHLGVFFAWRWINMKIMLHLEGTCYCNYIFCICCNEVFLHTFLESLSRTGRIFSDFWQYCSSDGADVTVWDIKTQSKFWEAKAVSTLFVYPISLPKFQFLLFFVPHVVLFSKVLQPRRDSNGLMSPAFVTASTFLGDDHHKLIIGTGHHQVSISFRAL